MLLSQVEVLDQEVAVSLGGGESVVLGDQVGGLVQDFGVVGIDSQVHFLDNLLVGGLLRVLGVDSESLFLLCVRDDLVDHGKHLVSSLVLLVGLESRGLLKEGVLLVEAGQDVDRLLQDFDGGRQVGLLLLECSVLLGSVRAGVLDGLLEFRVLGVQSLQFLSELSNVSSELVQLGSQVGLLVLKFLDLHLQLVHELNGGVTLLDIVGHFLLDVLNELVNLVNDDSERSFWDLHRLEEELADTGDTGVAELGHDADQLGLAGGDSLLLHLSLDEGEGGSEEGMGLVAVQELNSLGDGSEFLSLLLGARVILSDFLLAGLFGLSEEVLSSDLCVLSFSDGGSSLLLGTLSLCLLHHLLLEGFLEVLDVLSQSLDESSMILGCLLFVGGGRGLVLLELSEHLTQDSEDLSRLVGVAVEGWSLQVGLHRRALAR